MTAAIARHNLQRAVVRVDVQATREQAAALNEEAIRQQLEQTEAFFIAGISMSIEREGRSRLGEMEQELMQGIPLRRALEMYLQSRDIAPERVAELLAAADELLTEMEPRV
jgi:exonuclease SbcD